MFETVPIESPSNDRQVKNAFATLQHQDEMPLSTNQTTAMEMGTMAAMGDGPSEVGMVTSLDVGETSIAPKMNSLNTENHNEDFKKPLLECRNDSEVSIGAAPSQLNFDKESEANHKTTQVGSRLDKLRAVTMAISLEPELFEDGSEEHLVGTPVKFIDDSSGKQTKRVTGSKQPNVYIKLSLNRQPISKESLTEMSEKKKRHNREKILDL